MLQIRNSRCFIEVNTAARHGTLLHKNILWEMKLLIGISFIRTHISSVAARHGTLQIRIPAAS